MSRRVIWQQCFDHKWCVHVPWPVNKDICEGIHACVALIEDGGTFLLEVSVNGTTKDISLANVCVPIPVGPVSLQVCVANLQVSGRNVAFDLALKACIDANIGPIHVNQCVMLFSQHISVNTLAAKDLQAFGLKELPDTQNYFAYTMYPLSAQEETNVLSQPEKSA